VKALKPTKKTNKHDRERKVLLGLVEHYLKSGKPVGSHTLQEEGFADLSSATIRNYFAKLENEGYLQQQHSSGGRIPTEKAYRFYAITSLENFNGGSFSDTPVFENLRQTETKEIASFLQKAAEQLAEITQTAVFLSAPRFEQDFIIGIKLVPVDGLRCLCILNTDFGEIKTEIVYLPQKLSTFTIKRIEAYFNWRLTGRNKPDNLNNNEENLAQGLYNELMIRFIVNYSHFGSEEIYRTGFSLLLNYPEFHDPALLANSLSLFEHPHVMHLLLKEAAKTDTLKFWIGDDLKKYSSLHASTQCAVLAISYRVNKQSVGSVGLLAPMRIPYQTLFTHLTLFAESISEALTRNLYKFKISLRQSTREILNLKEQELRMVDQTQRLLLEDKRILSDQKQDNLKTRRT